MKRGRKSAAQLATAAQIGPRVGCPPPADLTADQQIEWRAIVAALPAGWFTRESWPVLSAYCRHVDRSRRVAAVLDHVDLCTMLTDGGLDDYRKLAAEAREESRAALACARSLRLTQQSRSDPKTAARRTRGPHPVALDWSAAVRGRD